MIQEPNNTGAPKLSEQKRSGAAAWHHRGGYEVVSTVSAVVGCFYFIQYLHISVALVCRRGESVVVKTNLENLPTEIALYRATEDFLLDAIYRELNAAT